jgi:hypothetical protein
MLDPLLLIILEIKRLIRSHLVVNAETACSCRDYASTWIRFALGDGGRIAHRKSPPATELRRSICPKPAAAKVLLPAYNFPSGGFHPLCRLQSFFLLPPLFENDADPNGKFIEQSERNGHHGHGQRIRGGRGDSGQEENDDNRIAAIAAKEA